MKHIKIYEEYSDDEIKDLMGDLHKVGHSPLVFELYFPEDSFGQRHQKKEEEYAENWKSEIDPSRHIVKVEGAIPDNSDSEWVEITLNNGDFIEYSHEFDRRYGNSNTKFKIDGREYPECAREIEAAIESGEGHLERIMSCYDKEIKKHYF